MNSNVVKITEKDGAVTGVKVKVDGKEKTIKAKSVVIAAGGFGANMDMITEYKPELKNYVTTNQEGATGDGIDMAKELGAATVDMDKIQIHPTVYQEKSLLIDYCWIFKQQLLLLLYGIKNGKITRKMVFIWHFLLLHLD